MRLRRRSDGTRSIITIGPNIQRTRMYSSNGCCCWHFGLFVAMHLCVAVAAVMVGGGVQSATNDNIMLPTNVAALSSETTSTLSATKHIAAGGIAVMANADGDAINAEVAGVTDAIEGNSNYININNNNIINNNNNAYNNVINNNDNNIDNGNTRRDFVGAFPPFHKEVVEQLIKQWAPIVWLAPEEQFLPLGVDEFLNHVHATGDKGKTFMPGMPIGDSSTKAFLVTNTDVDELLKDENSFIYGRNPNETPVPIYAVVTLCNAKEPIRPVHMPIESAAEMPSTAPPPSLLSPGIMPNIIQSTRASYIPVSIDPYTEQNQTVRRSSRLYPVFKRLRRNVPTDNVAYRPPHARPLPLRHFQNIGETSVADGSMPITVPFLSTTETPVSEVSDEGNANVNNFIANLVDNVKFSGAGLNPGNANSLDSRAQFDSGNYQNEHDLLANVGSAERINHKVPPFHVTYWMFYPYSQGKSVCTLSLGPLGRIPFPAVYGYCLGKRRDIGSHIGDWEHMSLYFNGGTEPEAMYVSAHDAGAYYSYNQLTGSFEFKKQETRKGILQRPNFPKTVTTFNSHPVLFAAKGSHGLWTAPGKHRFVKVARLYDINGFGTPWNTWKSVDITYKNLKSYGRSLLPSWLSFKGKWGNPKSKCHPFRRIGLNFCEYTDGPTGIPLKEPHFQCGATYQR